MKDLLPLENNSELMIKEANKRVCVVNGQTTL